MLRKALFLLSILSICVCARSHASPTDAVDRAALLKDVHSLIVPGGIPGDLVVFGDHAFTLVTGRMGRANLPVFAAARYGTGRVVLGGHEGFFGDAALKGGDNVLFARNIASWAADKDLKGIRVELIDQTTALRDVLTGAGCNVHIGRTADLREALDRNDLLWINQATLDGDGSRIAAVREWVKLHKGGLIITGPAWGWQSINSTKDLAKDQSGNQIAMPIGLAFAGGMLNGRRGEGYSTEPELLTNSGANEALTALEAQAAGTRTLSAAELSQVTTVLGEAVGALTESDGGFARRVTALCADKGSVVPTKETPITTAMPFARLKAVLDMQRMRSLPAEQVKAHPSAASFPGSVPADAKRESRTVRIDCGVPEWHSVGLYPPAGEVITITQPTIIAGKGFGVRIGEHTDTLWNLDKWERFPEISMTRPLRTAITKVASGFGGTLFIEAPKRSGAGEVDITIAGAVAAPRFVHGETTKEQWLNGIRSAPGPWAELQGKLVALSVPSSAVRDLEDPESLMAYWDDVMENCYGFFAAPKRGRPERYCVDRQISAGHMHSGYPIMTGDDVAKTFCDVAILRGSSGIKCWGFYHEMGHNFQRPRTELQKHDQFLERFSRLTGHNLTRYLKAWGIDFSPMAERAVTNLPDWMPADWK